MPKISGDEGAQTMAYFASSLPFVDPAFRSRLPPRLAALLGAAHVEVKEECESQLRIRASSVDDWWFVSIGGKGQSLIGVDRQPMSEHALVMLPLRGRSLSLGSSSIYPPVGEILLSRWERMDDVMSSGEFDYLCAYIPRTYLESFVDGEVPYDRPIDACFGTGAVLAATLRAMVHESLNCNDTAPLSALLPQFTQLMLSALGSSGRTDSESAASSPKRRFSRVMSYLTTHLHEQDMSPQVVAHACGLSERQLYRDFASESETFATRLSNMRLEKATELLLRQPDRQVADIAHECGFSSHTVFSRVFRLAYGMTPRDFRVSRSGGPA